MLRSPYKYFGLTILLIFIDQVIKFAIHHFLQFPGNEVPVIGQWLKLHYVLNPGMAFGMTLDFIPNGYGKVALTVFRIIAMFGIGYYLTVLAKKNAHVGLLWSIASILAGAIGNVIDSIFYGIIFDNAPLGSPMPWFHGQVIDMFFFDFYQGWIPEKIPVLGGTYYSTPIFNFADACIFCGVVAILIWQNTFFAPAPSEKQADADTVVAPEAPVFTDEASNNSEETEPAV